jgi:hypothetical protein
VRLVLFLKLTLVANSASANSRQFPAWDPSHSEPRLINYTHYYLLMDSYEVKIEDMAQKYCKRIGCRLVCCLSAQSKGTN